MDRLGGWFGGRRRARRERLTLIHSKQELMRHLPEQELLSQKHQLIQQLQAGKAAHHELCLAAALVKEAVRRTIGVELHNEQLEGGCEMIGGRIAEMKTGEGKTLASLIPLFWFALQGRGVHMITANPYLAERDYLQASSVLQLLGVTVGLNRAELTIEEKQLAYGCDVTYGTWSEFGFDYLRDHLVYEPDKRVQRGLACAILDEVDSILIDEARTPIIIASKSRNAPDLWHICNRFVQGLREGMDYECDAAMNQASFSDRGISKIESIFQIDNLFDPEHTSFYHGLLQCLRARVFMKADRDYLIAGGKVVIIDAFTGRVLEGREFGDGLQQAIEMKEGLMLSEETQTHASISVQKYFSLYEQMTGMSGTVQDAEEELFRIYGLEIAPIRTHRPVRRVDAPDLIFATREAKLDRLVRDIAALQGKGVPVLVGTVTVEQSEQLAERLARAGLAFQLLNARTEQEEADIIGQAGELSKVTIATNMAGRGADIRLSSGVAELGGLHVMGLERNESRRIDLQLCGRSGRQGDPGRSQFYISLEDELFQRFAREETARWQSGWRWGEEGVSSRELLALADQAQQRAEQHMYAIRSLLFRLDGVVHRQREWFYASRKELLLTDAIEAALQRSVEHWMEQCTLRLCPPERLVEDWKLRQLGQEFRLEALQADPEMTTDGIVEQLRLLWEPGWTRFLENQELQTWRQRWRQRCLRQLDQCWTEHMEQLGMIRQGIHFRALESRDLVQVYEEEAYRLHTSFVRRYHRFMAKALIREQESWTALIQGTA